MKKQVIVLALLCASFSIFAQNEEYRSVVSANLGANAFGLLKGLVTAANEDLGGTTTMTATPTFALSYDYGVNKWFSIGAHAAFNSLSIKTDRIEDANGSVKTGDLKVTASRIPIQARALFHYGNSGRLDMYSGLSLGGSIWSGKASGSLVTEFENSEDNPFRGVRSSGFLPTGQLILFGLRGYITENIGIGFESTIGSPYFASLQLNYRLGSKN
jgi:hypothetical protein